MGKILEVNSVSLEKRDLLQIGCETDRVIVTLDVTEDEERFSELYEQLEKQRGRPIELRGRTFPRKLSAIRGRFWLAHLSKPLVERTSQLTFYRATIVFLRLDH